MVDRIIKLHYEMIKDRGKYMKITFLGTAAAEGIPSLFCNCKTCEETRKLKGKNIRKRSSVLINDDLIIDMGPDLYAACAERNISLDKLKYALITHCHFDHFYPENIEIRYKRYQLNTFPNLNILANSSVFYKLTQIGYKDNELHINRVEAELYKKYYFGEYIVEPIPANHAHEYGMSLNYIVSSNNKTILYASDSGLYKEEWIEKIKSYKFDCVIFDGTNIFSRTSSNHLNIEGIRKMKNMFLEKAIINHNTKIVCTHFSHFGLPLHYELEKKLLMDNIITAFDGMKIEI